jgi:hypothetical protein
MKTLLLNSVGQRDPVELIYLVAVLATLLIMWYWRKRKKDEDKDPLS